MKTYWKLVKGQSIDGAEAQFAMLRGLLKGKALSDFERFYKELSTLEAATPESVPKVLAQMSKEVFPERALQKQRRAMRRYLRKPNDMSTSAFYARLVELNELLTSFPNASDKSKLSQEELIEILEFALPNTWRMHMTLAQFVCSEKSPTDILNLCKEIEGIEAEHGDLSVTGVHNTRRPKRQKSSHSSKSSKRKRNHTDSSNSNSGSKICPIHGPGHSAEECLLLKSAIANGKKDYLDRKNDRKRFDKKKSFTTEEVNVLLQAARSESVTRALKVHRSVTNPSRTVQFHTQSDLQEQVEN